MRIVSSSCENDARWASGFDDLAGRRELAGVAIHPKNYDGVAVFVRRVELASGRIEAEEARLPALDRFPPDMRQRPAGRVHRKNHDAVVAAVRCVDEFSRWRNGDFGPRATVNLFYAMVTPLDTIFP